MKIRKPLGTRAKLMKVPSGHSGACARCGKWIKFLAARLPMYVVCNVYSGEVWDRIELFHPKCYTEAGEPHGTPTS